MDEMLGRWFRLREFVATRRRVDNTPPPWAVDNLRQLVAEVLDPLRDAVGAPVRVTSGFRSEQLNRLVRGEETSQHLRGEAVDFKVDGLTAADVVALILRLGLPFDQLIGYAPERGGHVHVSWSGVGLRRSVLWAPLEGGYVAWASRGVA